MLLRLLIMSTQMGAKGVLKEGAYIPRVDPRDFYITVEGGKKLTAIDVAQEAISLDRMMAGVLQGERDFSTHMLMLASKCEAPEDFKILCENVSFDMNWGRANPAPKIWPVYVSTIYRAWSDFGVKPLAELQVPQLKAGKVIRDADGEPLRQKTIIAGINQAKKAVAAFKALSKEDDEDQDEPNERRNPIRVLIDRFSKAEEGIDKEASELFQSLVFSYVNQDNAMKGRMVRALKRIEQDYRVDPEGSKH
jgi:hypothetical protein